MKLKDEAELAKLGYAINPADPTQAIPMATLGQESDQPDETWGLDRLGTYIVATSAERSRLDNEVTILSRRSTVQVFRCGRALSLARAKLKEKRQWGEWLRSLRISRTTAWEAIQLFERAKSEGTIRNMSLSEAKRKFKITAEPQEPRIDDEQTQLAEEPEPVCLRIADVEEEAEENDDYDGDDAEENEGDANEYEDTIVEEDENVHEPRLTITMAELEAAIQTWYADIERSELIDLLNALGIVITNCINDRHH